MLEYKQIIRKFALLCSENPSKYSENAKLTKILSIAVLYIWGILSLSQEDYVKYLSELDEKQFLHIRVFTNELKMIYVSFNKISPFLVEMNFICYTAFSYSLQFISKLFISRHFVSSSVPFVIYFVLIFLGGLP